MLGLRRAFAAEKVDMRDDVKVRSGTPALQPYFYDDFLYRGR